jgi:hypothetical protein
MACPNSKNYNNKNTYYLVCQWCLSAGSSQEMLDHAKCLTTHLTDGTFILHSVLTANAAVQEIPAESKLSLERTHPCRADGLRSIG